MASGDKLYLKFIDAYKAAFSSKSKQKQYSADGQALWNELKSDRSKVLDKIEELSCMSVKSRAVVETDSSKTETNTAKFFRDQVRDQDRSRSQFWLRDRDRQSSRPRPRPKK